jgi:hypothetical protein
MTCCDHDCEQGRECPARVAKIGQRIPAADPLPPSTWRESLRDFAAAVLLTTLGMLVGALIVGVMV